MIPNETKRTTRALLLIAMVVLATVGASVTFAGGAAADDQTIGWFPSQEPGDEGAAENQIILQQVTAHDGDYAVVTYGDDDIVAGYTQVEETADEPVPVELEDFGGFPGQHSAYLVSDLSEETTIGEPLPDESASNIQAETTTTLFDADVQIDNQETDDPSQVVVSSADVQSSDGTPDYYVGIYRALDGEFLGASEVQSGEQSDVVVDLDTPLPEDEDTVVTARLQRSSGAWDLVWKPHEDGLGGVRDRGTVSPGGVDNGTGDGEADDGQPDDGEADDGETDDGEADDGQPDDGETDDGETDDADDEPYQPESSTMEFSNTEVPSEVEPGEEITISATVANVGEVSGSSPVFYRFEDNIKERNAISLNTGEEETIEFSTTAPNDEGEYEHSVATWSDERTFTLTVAAAESNTQSADSSDSSDDGSDGLPGFGVTTALVALLGAALVATRRRR